MVDVYEVMRILGTWIWLLGFSQSKVGQTSRDGGATPPISGHVANPYSLCSPITVECISSCYNVLWYSQNKHFCIHLHKLCYCFHFHNYVDQSYLNKFKLWSKSQRNLSYRKERSQLIKLFYGKLTQLIRKLSE